MTHFPGWTPTDSLTAVRGEDDRRQGLPLDARLCAWIVGLTVAALLCLFFGDALAGWAGLR